MTDVQKTAVAPQKTAVAPQKTAVASQRTAVAAQGKTSAVQPPKVVSAPSKAADSIVNSGAEADIELVDRGVKKYALKLYHKGFHPNRTVTGALKHLGGKGYVADILDTGVDAQGREYELMEYVPAGSLARYDLRGNASAIVTIILRTAMALDACHRSGVIHKDIKPANILVKDTAIWNCVLCDFGIADLMNGDGKVITKQSRTPIYAAPEMYDPSRAKARIDGVDLFEVTPAVDFYSLGMTALSLWAGEEAFMADEEKMAIDKLNQGIPLPKNMPERLRKVVAGLLKKNPSERWQLKDIEDSLGGHWAVMHTLNPLSDVKLNADPESSDYAMTGASIGAFLNKVYMWQFDDAKAPADAKICQAIVDSFTDYEGSYMQLFFASKGDRFTDQESWMRYCCDWESGDNAKKAGPRDEDTRLGISMMKTIKGFGFKPYYEFEDDTVTFLEDLEDVDGYDKKYGLSHGLKGWLAVQYHENPDADLSGEFAYEDLLEDYVLAIEDIDPDAEECGAFRYARDKAEELEQEINKAMRRNRRHLHGQTDLVFILVGLPMLEVVKLIVDAFGRKSEFVCWVFMIAAAAVVIMTVVKVLLHKYNYTITYYAGRKSTDELVSDIIKGKALETGLEERLVEPLYYAFSDEKDFDSSLNGIYYNGIFRGWGDFVKERRKRVVKHILLSLVVLFLAALTLSRNDGTTAAEPQIETTEINE